MRYRPLRFIIALCLLILLGFFPLTGAATAAPLVTPQTFAAVGYPLELLASFTKPMAPSGVAVSRSGRIFLSIPRHTGDHPGPTLAELKQGRLVAFPNAAWNPDDPGGDLSKVLVSVHGITMDSADHLWVIDDGKREGRPIEPDGAKVVGFDAATGALIGEVVLAPPALLPDSHMNDLRIDLTHGKQGTALIADSSFKTHPALVVVDLATGSARRRLVGHPSTVPVSGFVVVIEGRPLPYDPARPPTSPRGGIDGITLSADSTRLWFSPLTSRRLYSAPTALLANSLASDEELAAAVVDEGEAGVSDGMATDQEGRIYRTNHEQNAIIRRTAKDSFELMARDDRLLWPDGIAIGPDHCIYVTAHQSERLPEYNANQDMRLWPISLFRSCPAR